MKNLVFKQLVIISESKKQGRQFNFTHHLNLITAKNNSFGKSTLAKLLVWTLGCEPYLDSTWKNLKVHCRVDFNIENNNYRIERYGNSIIIYMPDNSCEKYSKITGKYTEKFAEIVSFKALLSKRLEKEEVEAKLEAPPPAYYYLPFYIDQQFSWSKAWTAFSYLSQYETKKWQKTIIEYHMGYISQEYLAIEKEISSKKNDINIQNEVEKKINNTIEIINTFYPYINTSLALTNEELDILKKEVSEDISLFQTEQEILLESIANLKTKRIFLSSQLELANLAIDELEQDYLYSVEYHQEDVLLCPLCGTEHNNSSPNRALLLSDKNQTIQLVKSLRKEIENIDIELSNMNIKSSDIKSKINQIRCKYYPNHSTLEESIADKDPIKLIDIITVKNVQEHVEKEKNKNLVIKNEITTNLKILEGKKRKLLSQQKKIINKKFLDYLNLYINKLDAKGVNLADIKSPQNFNKLNGSGGAAECTRGLLAYYMAVLKLIEEADNEVFASIIIDTPNQQEQANFNYKNILNFLIETIPSQAQLILCAMDCEEINCFKEKANVIELDEEKILKSSEYLNAKNLLNMDIYNIK